MIMKDKNFQCKGIKYMCSEEKTIILGKQMPHDILITYNQIIKKCNCKIIITPSLNKRSVTSKINNNTFRISINTEVDDNYFWEIFLHEHLHVLQTTEGYKDLELIGCGNNIRRILYSVNNMIMDIDVYRRLKQIYNFKESSSCGYMHLCGELIKVIDQYQNFGLDDNYAKFYSSAVSYIALHYNKEVGDIYAEYFSMLNPAFNRYYKGLIDIVNQNPQIGYTHIHKMQVQAMDLFELKCYKFV